MNKLKLIFKVLKYAAPIIEPLIVRLIKKIQRKKQTDEVNK